MLLFLFFFFLNLPHKKCSFTALPENHIQSNIGIKKNNQGSISSGYKALLNTVYDTKQQKRKQATKSHLHSSVIEMTMKIMNDNVATMWFHNMKMFINYRHHWRDEVTVFQEVK